MTSFDNRFARELARSTEMRGLVFLLQDALRCDLCAMPATCRVHRSEVSSDWGPASCDEHADRLKEQESYALECEARHPPRPSTEGVTVVVSECGNAKFARRFRALMMGEAATLKDAP
jgi:hypothetical protein